MDLPQESYTYGWVRPNRVGTCLWRRHGFLQDGKYYSPLRVPPRLKDTARGLLFRWSLPTADVLPHKTLFLRLYWARRFQAPRTAAPQATNPFRAYGQTQHIVVPSPRFSPGSFVLSLLPLLETRAEATRE